MYISLHVRGDRISETTEKIKKKSFTGSYTILDNRNIGSIYMYLYRAENLISRGTQNLRIIR